MTNKIPLTKYISHAGYCSRRQAEQFIRDGRVFVNGQKAVLGANVDFNDDVRVNNKKLSLPKENVYIIVNKPMGVTCTNRKFKGEKNIFSLLPRKITEKYKLHIAGRLDKNSRGLVLLTNDGDLSEQLTHPRYEHSKYYEIKVVGFSLAQKQEVINRLKGGIDIGEGDGIVKAKQAKYLGDNKFTITLAEGKKRQIRRMLAVLNIKVIDLLRVKLGSIELGDLQEGKYKQITDIKL